MRLVSNLLVGCAVLALAAASAAPALADPPAGVTPRASDVAGVGSDTIQYLLDQFSNDYNLAHQGASSLLYSWDATNPVTGQAGDAVATKAGCAAIARPDGSSAGVSALEANVTDPASPADYCIDYAGSSRAPSASDPACINGGLCFIALAGDAVTWASRDAASGGTDAPASLTTAQLRNIYLCKITNWDKVGGRNAPIRAFLPQTSSGTRTFWLTALGGGVTPINPGHCVSDLRNTLQDNQGVNPALNSPEAIVPYSVADYLAQVYHDARCLNSSCTGSPPCAPAGTENLFGCDQHGVLGINEIGGSKPILPWPPPVSPCQQCTINSKFTPLYQRTVYAVVRYAPTADNIPPYLEPFFAASTASTPGWACSSPQAFNDIKAYGFLRLSGLPAFLPRTGVSSPSPQCGTAHH
jgi:ABC-type phosphate transport system substrate-binding protein